MNYKLLKWIKGKGRNSASEATPATLYQSGKNLAISGNGKVCSLDNSCESRFLVTWGI